MQNFLTFGRICPQNLQTIRYGTWQQWSVSAKLQKQKTKCNFNADSVVNICIYKKKTDLAVTPCLTEVVSEAAVGVGKGLSARALDKSRLSLVVGKQKQLVPDRQRSKLRMRIGLYILFIVSQGQRIKYRTG
jgi:hypothetical protein